MRRAAALGQELSTDERHELGSCRSSSPTCTAGPSWRLRSPRYRSLPPEDRSRACVFGRNYGEAGAIDFFGARDGLPRAVSGHNSYYLWGPGEVRARS